MTREELINRISNREFVAWSRYFALKAQEQEMKAKVAETRARRARRARKRR